MLKLKLSKKLVYSKEKENNFKIMYWKKYRKLMLKKIYHFPIDNFSCNRNNIYNKQKIIRTVKHNILFLIGSCDSKNASDSYPSVNIYIYISSLLIKNKIYQHGIFKILLQNNFLVCIL